MRNLCGASGSLSFSLKRLNVTEQLCPILTYLMCRFDSKRIVSGAYDGKIKVWDLQAAMDPRFDFLITIIIG